VDAETIRELFAVFGPVTVTVRRMFGGAGVFADGMSIAIVAAGVIYLKADDRTVPGFVAEGMQPFSYQAGNGKRAVMSYWRMPDRLYDDPEELAGCADGALGAAQRAAARKSKRRPDPKRVVARRKRGAVTA
jgi:DNA transformation protein